jgi:hypothetical protein
MKGQPGIKVWLGCAFAIGLALEFLCLRTSSSFDVGDVFLFCWGMAPYLALLALPHLASGRAETIGAVVATVVGDVWGRLGYLFPTSSTAALILVFLPFWLCLVFIPLGVYGVRAAFWIQGRMHG